MMRFQVWFHKGYDCYMVSAISEEDNNHPLVGAIQYDWTPDYILYIAENNFGIDSSEIQFI